MFPWEFAQVVNEYSTKFEQLRLKYIFEIICILEKDRTGGHFWNQEIFASLLRASFRVPDSDLAFNPMNWLP